MANHSNTTEPIEYFMVGWLKTPKDPDVNYDVLQLLYNIIYIASLPLNVIFLAMIIKNPGSKTWTNMSIILASISMLHLIANGGNAVNQIYKIFQGDQMIFIGDKVIANVLAMTLTELFVSTFLLALSTYGLIVKPLLYKALSPKPRTMLFIILTLWLTAGGAFVILPLFVDDSNDVIQIIVLSFCWLITFIMAFMYCKIISTLWRRKRELQSTLNVATSRQGLQVIKQNSKLVTVLFLYILFMVLMSLPLATCLLLLVVCSPCNNALTIKFILYLLPPSFFMSAWFPVHWLLGTPQYYKEMKRLASKLLTCCKH
jgi:hypothetical protein